MSLQGTPGGGLRDYNEDFFREVAPGSLRNPIKGPPIAPTWVKEVAFDTWEAYAFVMGLVPQRLDAPGILRRDRRAVLIINTHVANQLWIGHSASVAVGNGAFVPAGGGAISLPLSEKAQIWAVSNGAATITTIVQFA